MVKLALLLRELQVHAVCMRFPWQLGQLLQTQRLLALGLPVVCLDSLCAHLALMAWIPLEQGAASILRRSRMLLVLLW